MPTSLSRRNLFRFAGAGSLLYSCASRLAAQEPATPQAPPSPEPIAPISPVSYRSTVGLIHGEDRRKMVHDALMQIDADLKPALKRKKYVLIKPNLTSVDIQLASTHPDTILGILDYLDKRFKGPVIVAEAASRDTNVAFEAFRYNQIVSEHRSQKVSLLDFNTEGKYVLAQTIDSNVHITPARLAARLVDPEAFVICAAIPKTHESMIMTAAVKNMAMGSPIRSKPKETPEWTDKRKVHVRGYQQHHYNLMLVSQKLAPNWGVALLDGYEGMEGNGPIRGTAVPSRMVIASKDFVAADRVAVETMGMNPNWVGYLQYCASAGLGNYDLAKIDVRGDTIAKVQRTYKLSSNFNTEIQWLGPLAPTTGPEPVRRRS